MHKYAPSDSNLFTHTLYSSLVTHICLHLLYSRISSLVHITTIFEPSTSLLSCYGGKAGIDEHLFWVLIVLEGSEIASKIILDTTEAFLYRREVWRVRWQKQEPTACAKLIISELRWCVAQVEKELPAPSTTSRSASLLCVEQLSRSITL